MVLVKYLRTFNPSTIGAIGNCYPFLKPSILPSI